MGAAATGEGRRQPRQRRGLLWSPRSDPQHGRNDPYPRQAGRGQEAPQERLTRPFFPISLARCRPFSAACRALFHQSIARASGVQGEPCGREPCPAAAVRRAEQSAGAETCVIALVARSEAAAAWQAAHAGAAARHFGLPSPGALGAVQSLQHRCRNAIGPPPGSRRAPAAAPPTAPLASASLRPPCSARRA